MAEERESVRDAEYRNPATGEGVRATTRERISVGRREALWGGGILAALVGGVALGQCLPRFLSGTIERQTPTGAGAGGRDGRTEGEVAKTQPTATAGAAAVETPRTSGPAVVEQPRMAVVGTVDLRIPPPTSYRPEDPGGVQNVYLEEAPKGRWFHPRTKVRFLGNREHIWSYQYYFANLSSPNIELTQHGGEEGRLIFRQETGPSRLVLGVGMLDEFVDIRGVRKDLRGDIRFGFRPDVVPSIWLRTHPNVRVSAWDPDSGQPLTRDGRNIEGTTSQSGDIGFGLGDCGRVVLAAEIPFDPKLETLVWKGPHDRVQPEVNWIDLRGVLRCVR